MTKMGSFEKQARDFVRRRVESAEADDPDSVMYGLPYGNVHPHDYLPDIDCCSPDERESWMTAFHLALCGLPQTGGNHDHAFTGDGQIVIGGTQTPWGVGTFIGRRTT